MGALVPILLNAAPFLADLIFGDKTGKIVEKAADIIGSALGVDGRDASALEAALAKADPAKAAEVRIALAKFAHDEKLAQIAADDAERQRQHQQVVALIQDVANARNHTVELARLGSPLAWGAALISALVVAAFGITVFLVFRESIPEGNRDMAFYIVGQISTFAGLVVGYWVGSNAQSFQKTAMLANSLPGPQQTGARP